MNKKTAIIFFIIGLFVVAFYLLPLFAVDESVTDLNEQTVYLEQDMAFLEEKLFEAEKFIVDSGLTNEYFLYPNSEILFESSEDDRFIILYEEKIEEDSESNYILMVRTNERKNSYNNFHIPTFEPLNGITWDLTGYNSRYYTGGIITDTDIKRVKVIQNTTIHEAEIFPIDDVMYGWYSFFDMETSDMEDRFRVRVIDKNDKKLWDRPVEELW